MPTPQFSHSSVWTSSAAPTEYPQFQDSLTADVAVIGGGICGLTAALLLLREGRSVVLLEADRIGRGTTGGSTAKLTVLHTLVYDQLEKSFGVQQSATYGAANQAGIEKIASLVEQLGIDCDFERKSAFTYTRDPQYEEKLRREADAAARAGLAASFTTDADLPFPIVGAVRVDNQAQFDPYRYCVGLARAIQEQGGQIFERSRATDVREKERCTVITDNGEVNASRVIVTTLLPFLDRGGFFARTYPSCSYGIAVELSEPAPGGMYITAESPTRSVRPLADPHQMIVVGEDHKVGHEPDTRDRYGALELWARDHFPVTSVTHRWSAQDYIPVDGLPFVGPLSLASDRVLTVTGLKKWGLAMGTAAAMILSDLILERENPWSRLFDTRRVDLLPSAKEFVKENADVAKRFVGDRLRSLGAKGIDSLGPGEANIVTHEKEKVAAYRDDSGDLRLVSPICTHMGCYVQWNTAERTWDCPCHGSRFNCDGKVIVGPAVKELAKKRP